MRPNAYAPTTMSRSYAGPERQPVNVLIIQSDGQGDTAALLALDFKGRTKKHPYPKRREHAQVNLSYPELDGLAAAWETTWQGVTDRPTGDVQVEAGPVRLAVSRRAFRHARIEVRAGGEWREVIYCDISAIHALVAQWQWLRSYRNGRARLPNLGLILDKKSSDDYQETNPST